MDANAKRLITEDLDDAEVAKIANRLRRSKAADRDAAIDDVLTRGEGREPKKKPKKARIDRLRKVLEGESLERLLLRAKLIGVATPDAGVGSVKPGSPAWVRTTKAWLVDLLIREAKAGNTEVYDDPVDGTWANYCGDHEVLPHVELHPQSLQALLAALVGFDRTGRVRAVAEGHAASAVARVGESSGPNLLVSLDELKPVGAPWEPSVVGWNGWRVQRLPDHRGDPVVRMSAGASVKAANESLALMDLALKNAGSYDRQQLFGALCTGTHGSGGALGPIADEVVSIDLVNVGEDGRVRFLRVEPGNGPTDRAAFLDGARPHRAFHWDVIQDDTTFRAVLVSFGAMGIATSVALRVRPRYEIQEKREARTWSWVKQNALPNVGKAGLRHDVLINPYPRKNRNGVPPRGQREHVCRLSVRQDRPWQKGPHRRRTPDAILQGMRRTGPTAARDRRSRVEARNLMNLALHITAGAWRSASHHVLRIGAGEFVTAYSCEIAVPLARLDEAIEVLAEAVDFQADEGRYTNSPTGVRFVRGSWSLLAHTADPKAKRDDPSRAGIWATIEVPAPLANAGAREFVDGVIDAFMEADLGARPHWGQGLPTWWRLRDAAANRKELEGLYGKEAVKAWRRVRGEMDPLGLFLNAVVEGMGLG